MRVLSKMIVRIGAKSSARSLRIRAGIRSGPDALPGLIFLGNFKTPSVPNLTESFNRYLELMDMTDPQ